MDHFPVKLLPRESQDWKTWGCEGCTEIFATKNEFNKHVVIELKKLLSPEKQTDTTGVSETIARLRGGSYLADPYRLTTDVLALCDDYETVTAELERLVKETRKLVDAASLWSRVDDHTYCQDDVPGGCVVIKLRNAIDSVEDLLLKE